MKLMSVLAAVWVVLSIGWATVGDDAQRGQAFALVAIALAILSLHDRD